MKTKYNDLINQAVLLEFLDKIINEFYFDEDNKRKIAFIMASKSDKYEGIRRKIKLSEEAIANIRKNIMIENYKHALHMTIILDRYLKKLKRSMS